METEELLKDLIILSLSDDEKTAWRERLSQAVNNLLLHDFPQLVQALYRVDVPEEILKETLKKNPDINAADLIVDLMLQRQAEKSATRNSYNVSTDDSDEEKW